MSCFLVLPFLVKLEEEGVLALFLENIDRWLGYARLVLRRLLPVTVSVNDEDDAAFLASVADKLAEVALLELLLAHFLEDTSEVLIAEALLWIDHAG